MRTQHVIQTRAYKTGARRHSFVSTRRGTGGGRLQMTASRHAIASRAITAGLFKAAHRMMGKNYDCALFAKSVTRKKE